MNGTFFKGVVLGAVTSTLVLIAATAFAGTGVGAVFNLGQTNSANARSTLKGATSGTNLQVTNTGSGGGIGISVKAGKHPIVVNASAGKATNLNADKLDGMDSTALLARSAEAYALVQPGATFESGFRKNFTAVSQPFSGAYCLTPAAGINPATRVAMVTPEWGDSSGGDLNAYIYANRGDCSAGQFEVVTEQASTSSDNVAFEIFVLKN